jgi:hypothetical protein
MRTIRIGAGAGYSGDRIEPAVELAERGRLDYLVFECLAERTIALAQQARQMDANAGFDALLAERFKAVLCPCIANKVAIRSAPRARRQALRATWGSPGSRSRR